MLAPLNTLANQCRARRVGLGAFNVIHLENAEAIIAAAERTGLPVVLQISENAVKFHQGNLEPLALATLALAKKSRTQVVVHLDHAKDLGLIQQAIKLGFTSIMYDGSHLNDAENRATTAQVAGWCRLRGVSLEAELGEVGGKDGAHAPGVRTNPADAKQFVADTGVDLLAVAVGSSHAMTTRNAALDLDLIHDLAQEVPVPLVLHGSSGVSDENMALAIQAGMTKINVSTHLNKVYTEAVRATLASNPGVVDTRKWTAPASQTLSDEVARLLTHYQSVPVN
ncbi:class II fructose-bisphosphate aldolase [Tessaracoccus caeni]|uniref:class II fructose-bisphosphate aldolase n=1 Tax=Tessaracoccus caeni TaxID=3031239 RepID=UPI0023DC7E35|nr:class II fructose-bisphosphate aldolase [Tessaracoccus caeni]MDF1489337.1 class II fructose-bisphosphate aldolase [Tessaracoccus caeni]